MIRAKAKIKTLVDKEEVSIVIKCSNKQDFCEVKSLIQRLSGRMEYTDNATYKIECVIQKHTINFIKRKFSINIEI